MRRINTHQFKKYRSGRWQSAFFANWWVASIVLGSYLVFSSAYGKKTELIERLDAQVLACHDEIKAEKERREELYLQIESHEDPRWIEMILMQKLGLVPEGQVKVFFQKRS